GKAGVGGEIDIQAWHLVETDDEVGRLFAQFLCHPFRKSFVERVPAPGTKAHQLNLEPCRTLPLPLHGVDPHAMAPCSAGQCHSEKITLLPAIGEIAVDEEDQVHETATLAPR